MSAPDDDGSGHGHDHDHGHDNHLDPIAARVRALETLLVAKGLVDPAAVDRIVDTYAHRVGPRNGARVVARAWLDADFRARLARDATAAIDSMGFTGRQSEHLRAAFNTPDEHNVVVCTLCSCYPWNVLGLPPAWYKSPAYRARLVAEPRAVLAEFGTVLPEHVTVRVHDSTAELRWLVVPERPSGTDAMDETALAALVTRDAMIGTARVAPPRSAIESEAAGPA